MSTLALTPGSTLGSIEIEALLGSGGMGEVYRGYDTKLQRRVAIKAIRRQHGVDAELKARFLREARMLSKLEHPAICQVYDLLETAEADYLILEFVEGQTLRQLMAAGKLPREQALGLAEKVARALAAAHGERVVHRDLKPENLMVTPAGEIKILDFGISRSLDGPAPSPAPASPAARAQQHRAAVHASTRETVDLQASTRGPGPETQPQGDPSLTRYGSVLGTMLYMSPEQAAGHEVTEASDLYSFGILLQELASDRASYPSLPIGELTGRVARGETLPLRDPDTELVALVEDLKRFHPAARPTAEQAAARLRGLIERPERLRRQRLRALALSGAFAALVLVLVVVSVLAVRARREAERASREAERATQEAKRANQEGERARQVAKFLSELFQEAGPDVAQGREVTARELLDVGAERIERQLADQPLVKASLQDTLGTIYRRLGNFETAERHVAAALAARLQLVGEDDPLVALSRSHLAEIYADQGQLERAEPLLLQAAASLERARGRRDPELAQVWNDLATLYSEEGRLEAAEGLYRQSLEIYEATFGAESNEVSSTLNNLAVLRWQAGDYAQALGYYERALETKKAVVGARHPDIAALQNNLGILHRELGNFQTAAELLEVALRSSRAVLGPEHPMVAQVLYSQGRLAVAEGQLERAQGLFEQSITIHRAASGDDHYEIGRGLVQLAEIDRRRGRLRGANDKLTTAFRVLEAGLGREHRWRLEALEVAARLALDEGRASQAAQLTREARELAGRVLPQGHPERRRLEAGARLAPGPVSQ